MHQNDEDTDSFTSGRSEAGGSKPSDLADLTELKIFSPTLDKSIAPPCESKKNGSKKKTLELSIPPPPTPTPPPSLKSASKMNGFPSTLPNGNKFGCISVHDHRFGGSWLRSDGNGMLTMVRGLLDWLCGFAVEHTPFLLATVRECDRC